VKHTHESIGIAWECAGRDQKVAHLNTEHARVVTHACEHGNYVLEPVLCQRSTRNERDRQDAHWQWCLGTEHKRGRAQLRDSVDTLGMAAREPKSGRATDRVTDEADALEVEGIEHGQHQLRRPLSEVEIAERKWIAQTAAGPFHGQQAEAVEAG
jgi:hypothetical protein